MSWLSRLFSASREADALPGALCARLADWAARPAADPRLTHAETRYAVLNTRASAVDADAASLQSVAAIVVENGRISPQASFHAALGDDAEPLVTLLETVGRGPVVVFNAELNRTLVERALRRHLGIVPDWTWLDLYWLLPALFGEVHAKPVRLSRWMDSLDLHTFRRFHALGDAWVLARLLLAVQSRALAEGRLSPASLADLEASLRAVVRR